MNNNHILQKMGVLTSFEIAKFIPNAELKKIKDECSIFPKKDRQNEYEKRIGQIGEDVKNDDSMPGIITSKTKAIKTENLLRYAIQLASEIQNKGISKEEQSFIIMSLTKLLELRVKNFKNWKESQKDVNDMENEENDDDDYSDDDED